MGYSTRATQDTLKCGPTLKQGDICESHVSQIMIDCQGAEIQHQRLVSGTTKGDRAASNLNKAQSSKSKTPDDICQGAALIVIVDVHKWPPPSQKHHLITQSLLLTEFESGIQMDLFHVSFVYSILDNLYCLYHIRVQNNLDMFDNRTLNFLVLY